MTVPLGNPFTLGATGVATTTRYDRLALGASFRPSTTPLGALSGMLYGPAGTMGDLTLLTDLLLRVDPFLAVIQGTHNTLQGQYVVPNTAQRDLAVPAKDAAQARRCLVQVRVADSLEAGVASSAATDGAWLEIKAGALAASNPVLPGTDPNSLAVGELLIPSTASGQPVTLTKYQPRTTTRNGILPVVADGSATIPGHDGVPGTHVDQYRAHPTFGLQRWDGTRWTSPTPAIRAKAWATASLTPTVGAYNVMPMGASRVQGGFTFDAATNSLVCPADGFYRFGSRNYWYGTNSIQAASILSRVRGANTLDLTTDMLYKYVSDLQLTISTPPFPLLLGDKIQLRYYPYQAGSLLGSTEFAGCSFSAEWLGPLDGVAAV